MADEKPPEGTPASTPDPAAEKAEYEAGLKKLLAGESGEEPPPESEGETKPEQAAESDEDDDEGAADKKKDGEGDDDEDGDPKVAEDALRKLQKEKRTFEAHKTEVLTLERQVKEREQRVAQGEQELRGFVEEMNTTGMEALLRHNLIPPERMALYSRQLFLLSPEGLKDPRSKPEAERIRAEMARDAESRRAMARVEKLEQERAAEKAQLQADRELNQYVASLDASLPTYKAKTPLLVKAMEKDASATKRELYSIAAELAGRNNDQFAEPGKVLLAWEKQQRERLARLGLSVPDASPAVQSKAKTPTAAKPQGQVKPQKGAPEAKEPADDDPPLEGEAYMAELRRRLGQR